jgi:hypothetical protein
MGDLGKLQKTGVADPNNPVFAGGWTIAITPADMGIRVPSEVYHIAIQGPAGSTFQVFLDTTFYDNVTRGDINSWDPSQPMHVQPGTTIYFYYSTNATPAPKATLFFREPSPL